MIESHAASPTRRAEVRPGRFPAPIALVLVARGQRASIVCALEGDRTRDKSTWRIQGRQRMRPRKRNEGVVEARGPQQEAWNPE